MKNFLEGSGVVKTIILILLIVSILLEGCNSTYVLTEKDKLKNRPAEDESVVVLLKDGSRIESDAYHHMNVLEPGDFIYGIGERLNKKLEVMHSTFRGKLLPSVLDSITTERYHEMDYTLCWLSDGSYVRFGKSDYMVVTPDQGAGFWCVGTLISQKDESLFKGKVSGEKIQEIQIQEIHGAGTFLLTTGILLTVGAGVLLVLLANNLGH